MTQRPDPLSDLDPDKLISESGEFQAHGYQKDNDYVDYRSLDGWYLLEGEIDEERRETLEAGGTPTDEELAKLRGARKKDLLESPDDDICPGIWFCSPPQGVDCGPIIVVLCVGYSFGGLKRWIFGDFNNEEDALEALRKRFYLSIDV